MSRERSPARLRSVHIIAGLQHLANAEEHVTAGRLQQAADSLWNARDQFTQSHSLDSGAYVKRAQQRLDEVNQLLQKELAGNA